MPRYPWLFDGDVTRPNAEALDLIAYLESLGRGAALAGLTGPAAAAEHGPGEEKHVLRLRHPANARAAVATEHAHGRRQSRCGSSAAAPRRLCADCAGCHGRQGPRRRPGGGRTAAEAARPEHGPLLRCGAERRALVRRARFVDAGLARSAGQRPAGAWRRMCGPSEVTRRAKTIDRRPRIGAGRGLYVKNCQNCHGPDGNGNVRRPPRPWSPPRPPSAASGRRVDYADRRNRQRHSRHGDDAVEGQALRGRPPAAGPLRADALFAEE